MAGVWDWLKSWFSAEPAPAGPATGSPASPAARKAAVPPAGRPRKPADGPQKYAANPEVLGLSAAEFRKRALKIVPWQTAWIGRVDTIPPQSDERTALIDRGLVLRGFLNEAQLAEIHTVGDLWIKHHDAARMAAAVGRARGEEAVQALRAKKLREKAEKRAAAAKRREELAAARAHRRATDVIFVGRGVSAALADRRCDVEKLERYGLPVLSTPADLAEALGVDAGRLRWLAWHGEAVAHPHYITFTIPKRSGGRRRISAPKPALKAAQAWILESSRTSSPRSPSPGSAGCSSSSATPPRSPTSWP